MAARAVGALSQAAVRSGNPLSSQESPGAGDAWVLSNPTSSSTPRTRSYFARPIRSRGSRASSSVTPVRRVNSSGPIPAPSAHSMMLRTRALATVLDRLAMAAS